MCCLDSTASLVRGGESGGKQTTWKLLLRSGQYGFRIFFLPLSLYHITPFYLLQASWFSWSKGIWALAISGRPYDVHSVRFKNDGCPYSSYRGLIMCTGVRSNKIWTVFLVTCLLVCPVPHQKCAWGARVIKFRSKFLIPLPSILLS